MKSVVAIENVRAAIEQIAQTTLRKVGRQRTLDETLSETDRINLDIREILAAENLAAQRTIPTMVGTRAERGGETNGAKQPELR